MSPLADPPDHCYHHAGLATVNAMNMPLFKRILLQLRAGGFRFAAAVRAHDRAPGSPENTGERSFHYGLILAAAMTLPCGPAVAQSESVVTISTLWSANGVKPGGEIVLAVVLDIREPYHVNAHNAKEPYIPTRVEIASAPQALRSSTPVYPQPHEFEFGVGTTRELISVFSDRAAVYIPMALKDSSAPGETPITVRITYQACDDKQCLLPVDVVHEATLRILDRDEEVQPLHEEMFRALKDYRDRVDVSFFGWDFAFAGSNLWLLLFVAAIGGLLLNFTPCVLPLIPIKIMGLSRVAESRSRCLLLGTVMSLGIVAFWMALAMAISTLSGFNAANKLFQYPAFTITVGVIICVMAVGMCGFFSVNVPSWLYRVNPSQESVTGSFLFGVMAAVLSTPCTAPFMGAAAAWATTQSTATTIATFAAIGVGMALPYFVLSAFPILVHRMPRTGPASELIKQTMGLLLLAAGAYFLGTGLAGLLAAPPDPPTQAYWWAVALFIVAAGGWLGWRTLRLARRATYRFLFTGLGALLIVVGMWIGARFTRSSPIDWVYFTPQRLAEAQRQGKVVVLEFTAAWCLNCHALEQAVLHHSRVVEILNSPEVAPVKVDITGNNPDGDQKLVEVGRRTIPYLVVYSRSGEEVFSSDAYSVDQLIEAIEKARKN